MRTTITAVNEYDPPPYRSIFLNSLFSIYVSNLQYEYIINTLLEPRGANTLIYNNIAHLYYIYICLRTKYTYCITPRLGHINILYRQHDMRRQIGIRRHYVIFTYHLNYVTPWLIIIVNDIIHIIIKCAFSSQNYITTDFVNLINISLDTNAHGTLAGCCYVKTEKNFSEFNIIIVWV